MHDLFSYPHAAGFKARDTVKAAASATPAPKLRDQVLAMVERSTGITPDECAVKMGRSVLSIRPRFSELANLGRIHDTGDRRANDSGRSAIVWTAGAEI